MSARILIAHVITDLLRCILRRVGEILISFRYGSGRTACNTTQMLLNAGARPSMDYSGNYPVDIATNHTIVDIFKNTSGTSQPSKEEEDKKDLQKDNLSRNSTKTKLKALPDVVCAWPTSRNINSLSAHILLRPN